MKISRCAKEHFNDLNKVAFIQIKNVPEDQKNQQNCKTESLKPFLYQIENNEIKISIFIVKHRLKKFGLKWLIAESNKAKKFIHFQTSRFVNRPMEECSLDRLNKVAFI